MKVLTMPLNLLNLVLTGIILIGLIIFFILLGVKIGEILAKKSKQNELNFMDEMKKIIKEWIEKRDEQ